MEIRALFSSMWRSRTGPILVAAQVALTLAVVVNVAYIVQQRLEVVNKPTGIDIENIFWLSVQPQELQYNYAAAVQADLAYLNALPGVVAATTSNGTPQTWYSMGLPFGTTEQQAGGPASVGARVYYATDKWFDALGVKFRDGKTFDPAMVVPPPADNAMGLAAWPAQVVITKALADKLFPKGDALGKTLFVGLANRASTIIGIIDYMQAAPIGGKFEQFSVQIVFAPMTPPGPSSFYIVRTEPGKRDVTMTRVEKEIADLQPGNRFVSKIEALEKTAALTRSGIRSSALILSVVGVFVLAVTMVGVAGLAAFNVATRTKQLGTRRAIGARRFHILRYFLVENWLITTTGALIGCTLALAVGVKLSQMYMMPRLPLYYLVAGVLSLWALGLLAVVVPARRAASISPATATRMV
jgi:putative ABC transport system permease protein